MSIETGLVAKVEADAGVVALIGAAPATRFYPLRLPQNVTYPAASYNMVSGEPQYTVGTQEAQIRKPRFQISAWGESYESAKDVANAIRTALDHQTGTWDDTAVCGAIFEGDQVDLYEPDTKTFQVIQEVILTHQP